MWMNENIANFAPQAQALSIEFKLDEIKGDSRVVLSWYVSSQT